MTTTVGLMRLYGRWTILHVLLVAPLLWTISLFAAASLTDAAIVGDQGFQEQSAENVR
jgi:hypothetical protein